MANGNGKMDVGEATMQDFEISLWPCQGGAALERATTDADGMYFLQVPVGRNYTLHFDLAGYSVLHFSEGQDTDTDGEGEGWTRCEASRRDRSIQWNAGLYEASSVAFTSVSTPPMAAAEAGGLFAGALAASSAAPSVALTASIGGFIYLDADGTSTMSPQEHARAVGGYTVTDAILGVTLTDCVTSAKISSIVVEFPGTYSFANLSEGWYRLGYKIVVLSGDDGPSPLYSFVEAGAENATVHETECGKLGRAEVNDSGDLGLRMAPPVDVTEKVSDGGPIGPQVAGDEASSYGGRDRRRPHRSAGGRRRGLLSRRARRQRPSIPHRGRGRG